MQIGRSQDKNKKIYTTFCTTVMIQKFHLLWSMTNFLPRFYACHVLFLSFLLYEPRTGRFIRSSNLWSTISIDYKWLVTLVTWLGFTRNWMFLGQRVWLSGDKLRFSWMTLKIVHLFVKATEGLQWVRSKYENPRLWDR